MGEKGVNVILAKYGNYSFFKDSSVWRIPLILNKFRFDSIDGFFLLKNVMTDGFATLFTNGLHLQQANLCSPAIKEGLSKFIMRGA
jgi:hypothetical protein